MKNFAFTILSASLVGGIINSLVSQKSKVKKYVLFLDPSATSNRVFAKEFYKNGVDIKEDFWQRFAQAYDYVMKVDAHRPFAHKSIRGIIDKISPDYVVYEFSDKTMTKRKESVDLQNKYMGR